MARERYLVGVPKEELEYRSFATPPTKKSRWEDFWYHHKWLFWGTLSVVAIVAGLIIHSALQVRPDYLICMVSKQSVSPVVVEQLEREFAAAATDVNGDGKVTVTVQLLDISSNQAQQTTNYQSVLGHLASKDVHLFVFDPAYYTETVSPAMKDGVAFFETLNLTAVGMSDDGTYWNWKDAAFLKKDSFVQAQQVNMFPRSMVCGVRAVNEKTYSESQIAAQKACVLLLKAFVEQQV